MLKRNVIQQHLPLLAVLVLGLALVLLPELSLAVAHAEGGRVSLFGRVIDSQGGPVRGAEVSLVLNGTPLGASAEDEHVPPLADFGEFSRVESQPDGVFVVDLPAEEVGAIETLVLKISRPHFQSLQWEAKDDEIARLNRGQSLRLPDIELQRQLTAGFWIAIFTFGGMLALIVAERLHNTMAALLGVAIILGVSLAGRPLSEELFILDFEQAIEYVDFNVIFLVMGMMIVVGVIEETGIFQWMAYQAYRFSRGRLWLLVVILMLLTSVASALLDNVTTMLLVAPITLQIALTLGVDPLSLLVPEMLASNVGGISTLIGTPNNILIGSYA
ncbi:MAG TPA: TRAP transporter large permease subunit, partial [Anaerolineae bacterium]|nr:TRAP transporter large permease subunit [Anaerolineae bacterium]